MRRFIPLLEKGAHYRNLHPLARFLARSRAPAPTGWPRGCTSPRRSDGRPCNESALVAGASEVQDYVELHRAVFESTNMTHAWRARTLGCLGYLHDLDLVAVAPDGRLAAFCIGWLSVRVGHERTNRAVRRRTGVP